MLLKGDEASWMSKVFMIYGAFWVTVLIVLYFAVGALLGKHDRHDGAKGGPSSH